jgi:hypothetical protein
MNTPKMTESRSNLIGTPFSSWSSLRKVAQTFLALGATTAESYRRCFGAAEGWWVTEAARYRHVAVGGGEDRNAVGVDVAVGTHR